MGDLSVDQFFTYTTVDLLPYIFPLESDPQSHGKWFYEIYSII